jgi:hypothetical protein
MDRWLFAITFIGAVTYTVTGIARALARPRPRLAARTRSSRIPHAHPMTLKERNARRRA